MQRLRLALLAAFVVVLDQLTKLAVTSTLAIGASADVIDGVLRFVHVRNTGAAFGLLRGWSGILALAAVVGVTLLAGVIWRRPPPLTGAGAALIAGGALGNLTDRLVRGPFLDGSVVDFIDFRFWPAFNVADIAISIGAVTLVVAGFIEGEDAGGRGADTEGASGSTGDGGADGGAADRR